MGHDAFHFLEYPSEPIHVHIREWNSVRSSLGGGCHTPFLGVVIVGVVIVGVVK